LDPVAAEPKVRFSTAGGERRFCTRRAGARGWRVHKALHGNTGLPRPTWLSPSLARLTFPAWLASCHWRSIGRRRPNIGTMKLLHISLILPAPLLGAGCSAYDPPVESDRTSEKYKADVVVVAATAAGLAIGYIWFSPIAMPAPAEVGSGRTSLAASAASPRIGATGGGEADHPPRRTKRTWILCSVPMQFTSHT